MRLYDSKQETDLRCLDKTSLMFLIIDNNMTTCIRLLFNDSVNKNKCIKCLKTGFQYFTKKFFII